MSVEAASTISCPSCRQPMQAQNFERHEQGSVRVDLCFGCAGIWFGHLISVQLAPAAVIELVKEIYARRAAARQPLASRLNCPRCRDALVLSYDLSKTGRFSYYSCHRGDGRFTPFFQFLREKQFVRNLTEIELRRLRSQVRQIRCSECGAPIDLEHDSQCKYCHAPVSFLDPDAVEKAARMWSEAEHRSDLAPHPGALGDALLHAQLNNPAQSPSPGNSLGDGVLLAGAEAHPIGEPGLGPDLIAWGIHAIGRLFEGES